MLCSRPLQSPRFRASGVTSVVRRNLHLVVVVSIALLLNEVSEKKTRNLKRSLRNVPPKLGPHFAPKFLPTTSFEAKKWLEVNFPSRGKVIIFPQAIKTLFSNPSFHGKIGHFEGKGKLFSRENYPSEGKVSP